jgi:hypothetical protein
MNDKKYNLLKEKFNNAKTSNELSFEELLQYNIEYNKRNKKVIKKEILENKPLMKKINKACKEYINMLYII